MDEESLIIISLSRAAVTDGSGDLQLVTDDETDDG